jgi:hypothetical protein
MDAMDVLMVDDQKEVFESLRDRARQHRIILHHAENLPDAIERLKENRRILGVIIDGKGFVSKSQVRGDEKADFVGAMLTQIALLEERERRTIPRVVLTAWYDELKDSLESQVDVFDKKRIDRDENSLGEFFSHLKNQIKNLPVYKIRETYKKIFEVVNRDEFKYSSEAMDTTILDLLQVYESKTFERKDYLSIRLILENIFISLKNLKTLGGDLFYDNTGKPNQSACLNYIQNNSKSNNEKNHFPAHIFSCFSLVKYVHNDLSHIDNKTVNTKYMFDSCVLACLEILNWIDVTYYK